MRTSKTLVALTAVALASSIGGSIAAAPNGPAPSIAPRDAIDLLGAGNLRFAEGRPEHRNASFQRLQNAADPMPFAAILASADASVPVERLFDRGFGDLFTVRVAGNVAGPDTAGSIEFAVTEYGTPLVVVLGHTRCSIVRAAANPSSVEGRARPIVDRVAPAVAQAGRNGQNGFQGVIANAVRANVFAQIEQLISYSPAIASAINSDRLLVTGAMYDHATGRVQWLGQHPEQTRIIAAAGLTPTGSAAVGTVPPVIRPFAATPQTIEPAQPATAAPTQTATANADEAQRPAQPPRRRFVNVPTRDD